MKGQTVTHAQPGLERWQRASRSSAAFSLVELLITLALILIMAVMLTGRGSNSRQKRDMKACAKNLQNIYTALTIYAADNSGQYPFLASARSSEEPLSQLVPRSTSVTETFTCPGLGS